jgi:hypothetical protein
MWHGFPSQLGAALALGAHFVSPDGLGAGIGSQTQAIRGNFGASNAASHTQTSPDRFAPIRAAVR